MVTSDMGDTCQFGAHVLVELKHPTNCCGRYEDSPPDADGRDLAGTRSGVHARAAEVERLAEVFEVHRRLLVGVWYWHHVSSFGQFGFVMSSVDPNCSDCYGVHMVRTQKVKIVDTEGDVVVMAAPSSGKGLNLVAFPETVNVEVHGLPWDITAVVTYRPAESRFRVSKLILEERPGGEPMPARGLRAFQLQGIVEDVTQEAAWRVRPVPGGGPFDYEPTTSPRIDEAFAKHLARGRTKSQESIRHLRAQAVKEYRDIKASGEQYPDTLTEIARRLNAGRTTVYQYLKDAGEIGKGKS